MNDRSSLFCFLGVAAFGLSLLGNLLASGAETEPAKPPPSIAYFLVIDHSGSMQEKTPSGKTRWEEMQNRAVEFLKLVPLESRIWLLVFSTEKPQPELVPFRTRAEREAALDRIMRGFGPPDGGTALYDTLGLAFEEAARMSRDNPNTHISVMAYTDGKDQHSTVWTPKKLADRFDSILDLNRNFWVFYTGITGGTELPDDLKNKPNIIAKVPKEGEEASPEIPLPVTLAPAAVGLQNPILEPQQTIKLGFGGSDGVWDLLKGESVRFQFVPKQGQSIQVQADEVPLEKGAVEVNLKITNAGELNPEVEYEGYLTILYPDMPNYVVSAPNRIDVSFQKEGPPPIYDYRPKDGSSFAAGRPVHFWGNTLQGAKVVWDFGDDQSASGLEVQHTYNTAGKRTVTITAVSDARLGETVQTFAVDILDIGVSVDPIATRLVAGARCQFACTGRGQIQRYEWIIDGQTFEGGALDDPDEKGSQLEYVFQKDGKHVVSVRGYAEKAVVSSEERLADVIESPDVQITQPQEGLVVDFVDDDAAPKEMTFRVEVRGPIDKVNWTIKSRPSGDPQATWETLAEIPDAVEQENGKRFSEVKYTFSVPPEGVAAIEITVEVVGVLPADIDMPPPSDSAGMRGRYPPPRPAIEVVGFHSSIPFGKQPVVFKLTCPQPYESVVWDFGDGTTDDTNSDKPQHTYSAHGSFQVQATVTGKSGEKETAKETVSILAQAPKAKPRVMDGDREARRVAVGNPVKLEDDSEGDIVKRTWLHNGEPLPAEQASVLMAGRGKQQMRLRVEGPPDREGKVLEDEREIEFLVVWELPWWVLLIAVALGLALYGLACWCLLGNQPRAWRIYRSLGREPNLDRDPSRRLYRYWRWFGKVAKIKMKELFPECTCYQKKPLAIATVEVRAKKVGKRLRPRITYSRQRNRNVEDLVAREEDTRGWRDKECENEKCQEFYVRVLRQESNEFRPRFSLVLIGLALLAGLIWVSLLVFRGI